MALSDLEPEARKDFIVKQLELADAQLHNTAEVGGCGEDAEHSSKVSGVSYLAAFAEAENRKPTVEVRDKIMSLDIDFMGDLQRGMQGIIGARLLKDSRWTEIATEIASDSVKIFLMEKAIHPSQKEWRKELRTLLEKSQNDPLEIS